MIWEKDDWVWKIDTVSLNEILYYNLKTGITNVFIQKNSPISDDLRVTIRKAWVDIVSYVNYFNKKIDKKYRGDTKQLKLLAFNLDRELTQIDFFDSVEPFPEYFINEEGRKIERDYIFEKAVYSDTFRYYFEYGIKYKSLRKNPAKYLVIDIVRQYLKFSILRYISYCDERESIIIDKPKWNYQNNKEYKINVQSRIDEITCCNGKFGYEFSNYQLEEIARLFYLGANSILNYANDKEEIKKFTWLHIPIFDYFTGISSTPYYAFYSYKYFQSDKYVQFHTKIVKFLNENFEDEVKILKHRDFLLGNIGILLLNYLESKDDTETIEPNIQTMLNKLKYTSHKLLLLDKLDLLDRKTAKEIKEEYLPNEKLDTIRKTLRYAEYPRGNVKYPYSNNANDMVKKVLQKYNKI